MFVAWDVRHFTTHYLLHPRHAPSRTLPPRTTTPHTHYTHALHTPPPPASHAPTTALLPPTFARHYPTRFAGWGGRKRHHPPQARPTPFGLPLLDDVQLAWCALTLLRRLSLLTTTARPTGRRDRLHSAGRLRTVLIRRRRVGLLLHFLRGYCD